MEDGCLDKTRNSVNNKSIGKRKMVDDILTTPIRCGRKYGDINGDSDVGTKNASSDGSLDKGVSGPNNVPRTPHLSPIGFSLQIDYESVEVEELMVEDSGGVRKEIITQRTRARNPHGHVLRMSSLEDVDLREPHDRPPPTILLGKENIDTNIVPVDCHVKTWSTDKDRGQPSPIGVDMDKIDNVDLREAQDIPHSTSLLGCDTIDNNIGPVSCRGKTRSADIDHTLQTNIVADTLSIVGDTNNPPDDRHERLDGQTPIILSATDNIDANVAPVNCSARTSSADNARGPINEALEQFTAVLRNMDPSGHNSQPLSTDDVYVPDSGITNFMGMERGQSSNADNTIQTRNPTHFTQNGKGGKKSKPNKCTTCGKNGHNRATCKNPI
ncbi:predicted protein [Arabidopsis lyrata subsp. lyrata]|uniref:Predicted protein n=1 Tax=Arabidopsis lyrata subsp. lyrata TaxID=81972 RepID=D7KIL5_ARALL|nr:predicted protein [Arabidopsis lyrata subsp. lyrata]